MDSLASNQWTLLYRGNNVREYYTVMPYAVYLRKEDEFFAEVVRRVGWECGIVVEIADVAAFNSSTFVQLLMELPNCRTPDGENGFLRYYDPSVLAAFTACADQKQLARLFGPYISSFWYEDAYQEKVWRRFRPDNLPEPASGPFQLVPDQFESLMEAQYEKYVQVMAREIRREFYPDDGEPSPELDQYIHTALQAGEQYSYVSRSEGYQFVRAAVRHGWNFYEREPFQKLLQNPRLSRLDRLEALDASEGMSV